MPDQSRDFTPPWTRVLILLLSLLILGVSAHFATGEFLPSDPKSALIFQNALLLIILGSALLEHRFTKPADSAVNGLMGALTLLPVYGLPNNWVWWLVFLYCSLVCLAAMICVGVSSGPTLTGWQKRVATITYRPAVVLGKSRLLYSIVFLYGVISFYGIQSSQMAILVLFWGIFIAIWPLGLPELLASFRVKKDGIPIIGKVVRTDAPNIIHAIIESEVKWEREAIKVLQQGDGKQRYIIPLFSQAKDDQILGTGICVADVETIILGLEPGNLYEAPPFNKSVNEILTGENDSQLIGFVEQDSKIGQLRFQTWNPTDCKEGMLIWAKVGSDRVYYQITEGITQEEGLESDRHGYQVAFASQLGLLNPDKGFEKFAWLPAMNTPVFSVPEGFGKDAVRIDDRFQIRQRAGYIA
jgi:hypothetical protein